MAFASSGAQSSTSAFHGAPQPARESRGPPYADVLGRGPPRPTSLNVGSFNSGFDIAPFTSGAAQPATCEGTEEPLLVTMRVSEQGNDRFKWEFVTPGGHVPRLVSAFHYPRRSIQFGKSVETVARCSQGRARCVSAFCKSTGTSRRCEQSTVSENDFVLLAEKVPADDRDGNTE